MFKSKVTDKVWPGDFDVRFLKKEGKTVSIRVGPRYRQWQGTSVQGTPLNLPPSSPHTSILNFYTHSQAPLAITVSADMKRLNLDLREISRYYPVSILGNSPLTSADASGGIFRVPFGNKTNFWIKIPNRPDPLTDLRRMATHWCRIEYGPVLPTNPGTRYDAGGNLSYDTFIPIFTVTPDSSGLNTEPYEFGELRYFDPTYYSIQNGTRRDLVFPWGNYSVLP